MLESNLIPLFSPLTADQINVPVKINVIMPVSMGVIDNELCAANPPVRVISPEPMDAAIPATRQNKLILSIMGDIFFACVEPRICVS